MIFYLLHLLRFLTQNKEIRKKINTLFVKLNKVYQYRLIKLEKK